MCEYLAAAVDFRDGRKAEVLAAMRAEASQSGYHIQINEAIPATIRGEILSAVGHQHDALLNITTSAEHNCIEDVFASEFEHRDRKAIDNAPFVRFLHRLSDITSAGNITMLYTEGAEIGWSPLPRYKMALADFTRLLLDFRDRADYDARGTYEIVR